MAKISPSILAADFANIGRDIQKLEAWGASLVHCDIMDGVFVPNISFGPQMIRAIRPYTSLPLNVHLMIVQPEKYIEEFVKAGADIITVHQESTVHLHRALSLIKSCGVKAGVALNPATSISSIENALDIVDLALIMTVNPGYGGQSLIPSTLGKVAGVKRMVESGGYNIEIEVDGGVNESNATELIKAGADILVAGTAVFSAEDPQKAVRDLGAGN